MGRSGTHKLTTTQRGLGHRHKQRRATLLRNHVDGTPCWWCGKPMYRSQDLDADHSVSRNAGGKLADRLLHASCNSSRGDGRRDDQRPALGGQALDEPARMAGCVMRWP